MTVRARLTLWNVLVFAVATASLGILVRSHVKRSLEAGVDRVLENRSRRFRERRRGEPERRITKKDIEEGRARYEAEKRKGGDTRPIFFFDADARSLASDKLSEDPDAVRQSIATGKAVFSTAGETRSYTFPVPSDVGPVVWQSTESLAPTNQAVMQFTRSLLTMIPIAALIAGAGGMFLTGRALQPVRAATDAAAKIGASDLSQRLPVAGKDEFARLATTFNGMLGRLEEAFDRQRRFVADASHEIKTPLTVIKANTSLALADPHLPRDSRETLTEIDQAADRTARIVQDMLLLAKSDADQLALRPEPVDVSALLRSLAAEAPRLHQDGPPVQVDAPAALTVHADAHHLRRLLTNLLDNALRHTPPSGSVALRASADGPFVTLTVADTGRGIAPEHLPFLGERFYRVDASRGARGRRHRPRPLHRPLHRRSARRHPHARQHARRGHHRDNRPARRNFGKFRVAARRVVSKGSCGLPHRVALDKPAQSRADQRAPSKTKPVSGSLKPP